MKCFMGYETNCLVSFFLYFTGKSYRKKSVVFLCSILTNSKKIVLYKCITMHGGDFILEVGGGDWASHMMEHELGGMFDVAHGAGFATIWGIRAMEEYDGEMILW